MSTLSYKEPKSVCACGHPGDGPDSQHTGVNGHGACFHAGCKCKQFTWSRFTAAFTLFLVDNGVNRESVRSRSK